MTKFYFVVSGPPSVDFVMILSSSFENSVDDISSDLSKTCSTLTTSGI